jgi:hypothetical protein
MHVRRVFPGMIFVGARIRVGAAGMVNVKRAGCEGRNSAEHEDKGKKWPL